MQNNYNKYVNGSSSFYDVAEKLKADGIEKVPTYEKLTGAFTKELVDFFLIDKDKNKIKNLELIFDKKSTIKYYVSYPLENIFITKDFTYNYTHLETKRVIIHPYIKDPKWYTAKIEPLKQLSDNKYKLHKNLYLNEEHHKNELTVYKFESADKYLEVIYPDQYLKNAIYGLSHYWNLFKNDLYHKSLLIQRLEEVEIKKEEIEEVSIFLNTLQVDNYIFELELRNNKSPNQYEILLSLKVISEINNKIIFNFKDFEKREVLDLFIVFYEYPYIIKKLEKTNTSISVFRYINYEIGEYVIFINGKKIISLANCPNLLKKFLEDFTSEYTQEESLLKKIKTFFIDNFNREDIINEETYLKNRMEIIRNIKNNVK